MLERLLRLVAVVASVLVVLGWGLFVVGEASDASSKSTQEIEGRAATRVADPSPDEERARERAHSAPREVVDDANDVLLSPFASLADSSGSKWVRRTVPAAVALLLYGFGLSFLARVVGHTG